MNVIAVFGAAHRSELISVLHDASLLNIAVYADELPDEDSIHYMTDIVFLDGIPRNADDVQTLAALGWILPGGPGAVVQVYGDDDAGTTDGIEDAVRLHSLPYYGISGDVETAVAELARRAGIRR